MFFGTENLSKVEGLYDLSFRNVIIMESIFESTGLEFTNGLLSSANKVQNMARAFRDVYTPFLNLSDMTKSSITTLYKTFEGSGIEDLDISGWFDLGSVTTAEEMFSGTLSYPSGWSIKGTKKYRFLLTN